MKRRAFLQSVGAAALLPIGSWRRAEAAISEDSSALVTTPAGTLRGLVRADGVRSFRGIPFALPPVGPLRFAAPRPLPPWSGVRDALDYAHPPIQSGKGGANGSEDCLYLNIWTPPAERADLKQPYPVFVWIHGGGNTGGSSANPLFDHGAFPLSGVIVVTLSYRLGALGFLELGELLGPEYADSGNNALRDLTLGLKWVRENIAAFGGDPTRITIGGQSAGAKNVAALMASPETRRLIRRAVMESGSGQTTHTPESAREVARRFCKALGVPAGATAAGTKTRLLAATTDEILKAQEQASVRFGRNFAFRPVVGGPLLPKRPVDAIASGDARDIDLLIGTDRDESLAFFARTDAEKPIAAHEISHLTVPQIHEQRLRYEKQFPGLPPLDERIRLLTAEEYWVPSVRFAQAHTAAGGATYMYRFERLSPSGDHTGYAAHGSEMAFVWDDLSGSSPKEAVMLAHQMHDAWVSFLNEGVPSAPGLPVWPRYAADNGRRTMVFNDTGTTVVEDPRGDERRLWDGVL